MTQRNLVIQQERPGTGRAVGVVKMRKFIFKSCLSMFKNKNCGSEAYRDRQGQDAPAYGL